MREEAYRELRRLIVEGDLAPGERLRDKHIAAWLGVSRTPIREALTRLTDEGLVEMEPNRYTRVRPLRIADAEQGYPVVAALAALAAARASQAGSLSQARMAALALAGERFEWAMLREDPAEMIGADDELHSLLAQASGSSLLEAQLDRLVPRLRQLELTAGSAPLGPHDPHAGLIDALESGRAEDASRTVELEWRARGERVVEALRRSPAGDA